MSRIPHKVERTVRRLAVLRLAALGLAALSLPWVAACGGASGGRELVDALAPHEEAVERFSRWAVRVTLATTPRDRTRLEETLFAPILDDERFVAAIVERPGRTPLRAARPSDASLPEGLVLTLVRSRQLGLVEAAHDPGDPSLLWVRTHAGREDGTELVLTLALRASPP